MKAENNKGQGKPFNAGGTAPRRAGKQDFVLALRQVISEAMDAGKTSLDVRAADLHARVGGYPGRGHAIPSCCTCMREAMQDGDAILSAPQNPSGAGPGLLIRYRLPR